MRLRKYYGILSVAVVIAVIASMAIVVYEMPEGAPELTIGIKLINTSNNDEIYGEIPVSDTTLAQSVMGVRSTMLEPLSTYTANIAAIDPAAKYNLEITVKGTVTIEGQQPTNILIKSTTSAKTADNYDYLSLIDGGIKNPVREQTISPASEFSLTTKFSAYEGSEEGSMNDILGENIDGSVVNINVTATQSEAGVEYYGYTNCDVTLSVDPSGNVEIMISEIGVGTS